MAGFYVMRRSTSFTQRPLYLASDGGAYACPDEDAGVVRVFTHDGGLQTEGRGDVVRREGCQR